MVSESKIRTVIVDDEPLARKRILDLLLREPDIDVLAECRDGFAAIETVLQKNPDLLFLDVQMPEMDGFKVVSELAMEKLPVIIFVTAYDQFAIKAFEVHALDYLLKPFDDERFAQAVERARLQIRQRTTNEFSEKLVSLIRSQSEASAKYHSPAETQQRMTRFAIKESGETILVKAEDVDYIEGEGVYVRLHLDSKSYLIRERLGELENRLDPSTFFRIHRSTIVNLERIKKLVPHFHGDYIVALQNGTHLKLSRTRREALQARLGTSF
ncbi:LytTR family DNA-binding domain-containing protein [bacterium]|nr:LytTR family DNA-binding domain-containing protein [bacterium]